MRPFGASEASVGAVPAATEGPRLWTEGGYVAQGRLDKTSMNTPTDPGHHQGPGTHLSSPFMFEKLRCVHARQRSFTNIARLARASHGLNGPAQLDLSSPDTH